MVSTGADSSTKHLLLQDDEDGASGGAGTAVATLPHMQGAATSVSSSDPVGAAAADEEAALLQDVPAAAVAACAQQLAGEDGIAGGSANDHSGGAPTAATSPRPAEAAALPPSPRQQAWPPPATVPTLEAVGAALEEPQQRLPLLVAPVWREAATSHTSTGASRVAAAGVAIEMRSLGLPLLREEDARAPAASAALSNISDLERQCFICLQEADRENPLIRCCSTC